MALHALMAAFLRTADVVRGTAQGIRQQGPLSLLTATSAACAMGDTYLCRAGLKPVVAPALIAFAVALDKDLPASPAPVPASAPGAIHVPEAISGLPALTAVPVILTGGAFAGP